MGLINKTDHCEIIDHYFDLMKQCDIAKTYKVSYQRIQQIIYSHTSPEERAEVKAKKKAIAAEKVRVRRIREYHKDVEASRKKFRKYSRNRYGYGKRCDFWTEEEDAIMKNNYGKIKMRELKKLIVGRTRSAIVQRARNINLAKRYNKIT